MLYTTRYIRAVTREERTDRIGEALYGLVVTAVREHVRDISLTAASTLSTLAQSGPRRITDLAAVEGVSQPSMTVLVTGLERAGLVARRADSADRRAVRVGLTDEGERYLRARRREGADAFDRLIEKLPPEEVAVLRAAAPALRHLLAIDSQRRDDQNGQRRGGGSDGAR